MMSCGWVGVQGGGVDLKLGVGDVIQNSKNKEIQRGKGIGRGTKFLKKGTEEEADGAPNI